MDGHQHQGGVQQPHYQLQDGVNVPEKTGQYGVGHGVPQHSFSQQHLPQYQQSTFEPSQSPTTTKPAGATILSVKRSVALATLAVLVFLFLTVIGLSAGLGVSQHNYRQAKTDLDAVEALINSAIAAVPTASTTPPASLLPTPASVASSATPSASPSKSSATSSSAPSATGTALVQCPGVNNTVYTVESTGQRFKRLCGLDYSGPGEAVDVANTKTNSLDKCIEACAMNDNCEGAGWGVIPSEKSSPLQSCWMKKELKKFHDAKRPDWGFAVLLGDDE